MQWGQTLEFPKASSKPWIQILHNSDNHWLMAASGYGQQEGVLIFDSLNETDTERHVLYSVAQICPDKDDKLKLAFMKVQQQKDGFNCGLFAIANATALAFQLNPCEFLYHNSEMRSHFITCCRNRKMLPFPAVQSRKCRNWRPSFHFRCDLYCHCKMPFSTNDIGFPERFRTIVKCKGCNNWYHPNCEQIPESVITSKRSKWRCSKCTL